MKYLLSLFLLTSLFADEVNLDIRVISADNESANLPVELEEISQELASLPYKNFQIVSDQKISLTKDVIKELRLPDEELLKLKLVYSNEKKYCIWLDWKDREGKELLNTKIHLNCSESVVMGTEVGTGGRILSAKLVK